MNETKPAVQSWGIMAPVVTMLITALVTALIQYGVIPADQETALVSALVTLAGSIAAAYGRWNADKKIEGIVK